LHIKTAHFSTVYSGVSRSYGKPLSAERILSKTWWYTGHCHLFSRSFCRRGQSRKIPSFLRISDKEPSRRAWM